jgi:hypothetical protein
MQTLSGIVEFEYLTQDQIDFLVSIGCKVVQYRSKFIDGLSFYNVFKPTIDETVEYVDYNIYREWR